jgi:diguanylate cyclase (GGDEF)-like protein
MTAAVLLAATGRFAHLPIVIETLIAVVLGLVVMFAFAPWKQIVGRARDRQDLRALTRSVRQFDHDHDREPVQTLQTERHDEIGELSRAIHQALTNATAHRLEAHRLRKSMDHSIRQETHRATGRLQREAQTDPLTGLGNRRALREQLVQLVEEARVHRQLLAALWIDVDHFKKVNDELGHSAGDVCLAFLGKLLQSSLRDRDCAFRNGGDEFVVLMPGASSDVGIKVAERIRSLFGQLAWTHTRREGRSPRADSPGRRGHVCGQARRAGPRVGVVRPSRRGLNTNLTHDSTAWSGLAVRATRACFARPAGGGSGQSTAPLEWMRRR